MHNTIIKKFIIALIVGLPTLSAAADATIASEPKGAMPAQTTAIKTQLIPTESKPPEAIVAKETTRMGYVDIARVGTESDRGKALRDLLMARKEILQGKVDGKKKQIEKLKKSIEAKIATMTSQQREAKSKEFQKKLDEFQKFARASEEELFGLQEKETKALYEDIERTAVAYGKANGFSVIVVKKELLYVGSAVDAQDVTEPLIKALNEAGQKK
ncbi:MAG: OmpH family outer membrane protein [Desulfuromonadaceae bacterium]|nr:OmpH family outer membrane protein [Desulfuromonadaceae bacterium]